MERLKLVTWNVLHRIHGEKWSKYVVQGVPEAQRIARISARVRAWLEQGVDAVCLQEVSGDQLDALRGTKATLLSHRYPRVPSWLRFWSTPLSDRSEHLVTLLARPGRVVEAQTYASDPGKGLLAVELDGLQLVNTHLSFGEAGAAQLAQAAGVLRRAGPAVLVGDFNAEREVVAALLGAEVQLAPRAGITRIPAPGHAQGKCIDHVACVGAALESAQVLDGAGLSDHHPVAATVRWGPAAAG